MSDPDLIIFGQLTLDNVVRASGEVLPQSFGGNCVYAALGARLWSDRVGVVSRYGGGYPDACFKLLQGLGIATEGMRRLDSHHRMNVAFAYQADGSRTRIIPCHLLEAMSPVDRARFYDSSGSAEGPVIMRDFAPDSSDMPDAWWASVRGIHFAASPLVRLLDVAQAVRVQAPAATRVHIDSAWLDNGREVEDATSLLRSIDLLLPSEQDFENHRPGSMHDIVARDLLQTGVPAIVLKRGSNGCRIFQAEGGTPLDLPVVPVDAIDPTGAGDSFCGGFLAGYLHTGSLVQAAHYGTVSASFCVASIGIEGLVAADRNEAARRLVTLAQRTGTSLNPLPKELGL